MAQEASIYGTHTWISLLRLQAGLKLKGRVGRIGSSVNTRFWKYNIEGKKRMAQEWQTKKHQKGINGITGVNRPKKIHKTKFMNQKIRFCSNDHY